MSDTTTKPDPLWMQLSFTKAEKQNPKWGCGYRCTDWFAVPDEDYLASWITGYNVMRELMALAKAHPSEQVEHIIKSVIQAACLEIAKPIEHGHHDKRGAACAVLQSMAESMSATAKHLDMDRWLGAKSDSLHEYEALAKRRDAKQKAEFVTRMKSAKAAKKQGVAA